MSVDDHHDTFEAARRFHATRIDWIYLTEGNQRYEIDDFVARLKDAGYFVTGALNSKLPDTPNGTTRESGRIIDKNGNFVALSWLPQQWNGDPTSPIWREIWLTHARTMIDAGVDALQSDDPGWMKSIGRACYTPTCLETATRLGVSVHSETFKETVTREFFETVHEELDAYAGHHIPYCANNFEGEWERQITDLQDYFDFGMAETDHFDVGDNYKKFRRLREMGKPQVFTYRTNDVTALRSFIAHTYAVGAHMIAPWDVYVGSHAPRLYTEPAEVADLYGFARAMAVFLDDYEDAAIGGFGLKENRYPMPPIQVLSSSGRLSVFLRARPRDAASPIVLHLLDTAAQPQAARIRIRAAYIRTVTNRVAHMYIPAPYDQMAHDSAEANGDYTAMKKELSVAMIIDDEWVTLETPAVHPWGILILTSE